MRHRVFRAVFPHARRHLHGRLLRRGTAVQPRAEKTVHLRPFRAGHGRHPGAEPSAPRPVVYPRHRRRVRRRHRQDALRRAGQKLCQPRGDGARVPPPRIQRDHVAVHRRRPRRQSPFGGCFDGRDLSHGRHVCPCRLLPGRGRILGERPAAAVRQRRRQHRRDLQGRRSRGRGISARPPRDRLAHPARLSPHVRGDGARPVGERVRSAAAASLGRAAVRRLLYGDRLCDFPEVAVQPRALCRRAGRDHHAHPQVRLLSGRRIPRHPHHEPARAGHGQIYPARALRAEDEGGQAVSAGHEVGHARAVRRPRRLARRFGARRLCGGAQPPRGAGTARGVPLCAEHGDGSRRQLYLRREGFRPHRGIRLHAASRI